MNIASQTLAYPVNHHAHRRVLPTKHASMLVGNSPVAVNNKIRAIQTRKSRITLQYDFSDIRPLNIPQHGRSFNSTMNLSNLSPEKLVERSKELRLARIAARQNMHPSVLSSTSIANQQSLLWPSYNSPTAVGQESQIDSPTAMKLSTGHLPDIHQRKTINVRQSLTEQQNSLVAVEFRQKTLPKTKASIPKAYDRTIAKMKSPFPSSNVPVLPSFHNDYFNQMNNNVIQLYESEEDDENHPAMLDEEFQEYVQKAMAKCADWLIKYVFDQSYDELDEQISFSLERKHLF